MFYFMSLCSDFEFLAIDIATPGVTKHITCTTKMSCDFYCPNRCESQDLVQDHVMCQKSGVLDFKGHFYKSI